MRIYLAGQPKEHERFNEYAAELRNHGFEVVSSWHGDDQAARLAERSQSIRANQAQFISKFMRITLGQNIAGEEITDIDRRSVVGGPPALEIDNAFWRFESELSKTDCVIADPNDASMDVGFALALGKRVILIGDSESPLIAYCIDKVKVATDWVEAVALVFNLRAVGSRRCRALASEHRDELVE
jgi:nucleoside 2-deoxyribosyltransferase